jgi:hypothetical protein
MLDEKAISLINLITALLIFGSAIIPLSYKIWRLARQKNVTDRVINIILNSLSDLSFVIGLVFGFMYGPEFIVVILFSTGAAFYTVNFIRQKSPVSRLEIVFLVTQVFAIVMSIQLYFFHQTLDIFKIITS